MADDKTKKPKIDLKARLGKTMQGAAVGGPSASGQSVAPQSGGALPPPPISVVPPMPGGGIPSPLSSRPGEISAPPVSLLPQFQPKAPPPAPKPVSAEQQTIKVELGEEIVEQRKKSSRNAWIAAFMGAVVGLGLGYLTGSQSEKSKRASNAIAGAGALQGDVQTAKSKMEEIGALLLSANESMDAKKYPADLIAKLAETSIAFDDRQIEGKSIGSLDPKTLKMVLSFTRGVGDLNDKKDALRNLLGAMKPDVEKVWADATKPKFGFAVIMSGGGEKLKAELVKTKEPWEVGAATWPKELTVLVREVKENKRVDTEKKANRFEKGDIAGQVFPIEPKTIAEYTADRPEFVIKKAMIDMKVLLDGSQDPQNATPGLIKEAEALANALGEVALKK